MVFIDNYYSLLPDFSNILLSCIPTVSYFISVSFYKTFFHKEKRVPEKKYIESSSKNMISSTPVNIFLSYPLFNYFSTVNTITAHNLLLGIFLVDTLEYFFHYFLHQNTFFYNKIHNVHHKPYPVTPETSFANHDGEILMTSPIILLTMVFMKLSFIEYIIVTSLSFVATVSDHTVTSGRKFHYIHHHVNKHKNLQQPFFTYWDHLFGTYYQYTELKIPFKP